MYVGYITVQKHMLSRMQIRFSLAFAFPLSFQGWFVVVVFVFLFSFTEDVVC